jgi:hypothetical protein
LCGKSGFEKWSFFGRAFPKTWIFVEVFGSFVEKLDTRVVTQVFSNDFAEFKVRQHSVGDSFGVFDANTAPMKAMVAYQNQAFGVLVFVWLEEVRTWLLA